MHRAGPFSTFVWFIPLLAAIGLCRDFFPAQTLGSSAISVVSVVSSHGESGAGESAANLNLNVPDWEEPLFCLHNGLRESDFRVVTQISAPQTPSLRFVSPFPVSEPGGFSLAAGDIFSVGAAALPRYLVFRSLLI